MNLWFWILWVFAGIVLLAELPHPWYYIGFGMLVFAFVCLILTVRRILTSGTKLECTMYLALYYNEKMSDVLLATGYDIPDGVVHAVLRSWKSKGWIISAHRPKMCVMKVMKSGTPSRWQARLSCPSATTTPDRKESDAGYT